MIFLEDSIVNRGNGGVINPCGLNCVVLICDVDLIVFVACGDNSSIVLNTKIKPTSQQIWNLT